MALSAQLRSTLGTCTDAVRILGRPMQMLKRDKRWASGGEVTPWSEVHTLHDLCGLELLRACLSAYPRHVFIPVTACMPSSPCGSVRACPLSAWVHEYADGSPSARSRVGTSGGVALSLRTSSDPRAVHREALWAHTPVQGSHSEGPAIDRRCTYDSFV